MTMGSRKTVPFRMFLQAGGSMTSGGGTNRRMCLRLKQQSGLDPHAVLFVSFSGLSKIR